MANSMLMSNAPYTEEELIKGCRQGQSRYQKALYELYSDYMMGICIRYCPVREEAEDVFQEAFVKVFNNIHAYNGGNFQAWLKRIFINTSINAYHKNKKLRNDTDMEEAHFLEDEKIDFLADLSASEIMVHVNNLPDGYRLVFNLYVVEGFTHQEIADKMNISQGTSKSQLFKAKAMLKKMLGSQKKYQYGS